MEDGTIMDPSALGPTEWNEIGKMLTSLWIVVLFIVLFATNMLLGHNFIPSLVATQDIPRTFQRTRPVFYVLALVCFGLALFFLSEVVDFSGVLRRFWANYWI